MLKGMVNAKQLGVGAESMQVSQYEKKYPDQNFKKPLPMISFVEQVVQVVNR